MIYDDPCSCIKPYQDHVKLWAEELKDWVPETIFDAHVHLGPPEAIGQIASTRLNEALLTFTSFTWEQAVSVYEKLYSRKNIVGIIAFGFPLREVNLEAANDYVITLMNQNPSIRGFVVSDPKDTKRTIHSFEKAIKADVRFYGVKPYFDLLGKSNYETAMHEFIPRDLLEFMNTEKLVMMLHTSGVGMAVPENQEFIKSLADNYPNIKIILAHMGRYLKVEQFFDFFNSNVINYPNIFLEMSTIASPQVYEKVLSRKNLWDKLMFGSDLPYGLITGIEYFSTRTGPTFVTLDDYNWSDKKLNEQFVDLRRSLTYNTYHTIKALKDGMDSLNLAPEKTRQLKQKIFSQNVRNILQISQS